MHLYCGKLIKITYITFKQEPDDSKLVDQLYEYLVFIADT